MHPILATLSTPKDRAVATVRLRIGQGCRRARRRHLHTTEALAAACQAGATGTVLVQAGSQFYNADVATACRRSGTCFSLTLPGEAPWTAIRYPDAFLDPDTGELVFDAEVAEAEYTAFTGRTKAEYVTARLIGAASAA